MSGPPRSGRWAPLSLTDPNISDVLSVGNGGTGNTTGQPSGAAGGALAGTYPNPSLAPGTPKSVLIYDAAGNPAVLTGGANNGPVIFDAAGNPVVLARGADAQVLTLPAGGGPPAWAAAAAGVAARLPTVDGTEYLRWTCDETALPLANSGSAGANGDMDTSSGTPAFGRLGFFNTGATAQRGAFLNGQGAGTKQGLTASLSGALNPALPLSLEVWLKPWVFNAGGEFFVKAYRPVGSWTPPFASIGLGFTVPSVRLNFFCAVGGVQSVLTGPTSEEQPPNGTLWNYIVGTWSAGDRKLYWNGQLIASDALAGPIDYGTNGRWQLGTSPDNATNQIQTFDEARVYNRILTPVEIATRWRNAMGWTA